MALREPDSTGFDGLSSGARNLDRPAEIPKVPAYLAHDRGHGERHKVRAATDVETVDRELTDSRGLYEIVKRFAAVPEPACDVISQRQSPFNDYLALTTKGHRPLVETSKATEHLGHFGILRTRRSHHENPTVPLLWNHAAWN